MNPRACALPTFAILCLLVAGVSPAAPQEVKVAKSGETSLRAVLGGKKVQITFHTAALRKSDPGFPLDLDYYDEVSIVRGMSIAVDGKALAVPWSVYGDLFNVRGADLTFEEGVFKLVTGGAGGADTYSVHIYFDAKRVIKRESYNSFSPHKAVEVILYSPPVEM